MRQYLKAIQENDCFIEIHLEVEGGSVPNLQEIHENNKIHFVVPGNILPLIRY